MKTLNTKKQKRIRRHVRIRARISGTASTPRLSVSKSNKHISAQLIDDENAVTLASAHSREVKGQNMMEKSILVGEAIAKKASAKKISKVVFDRGGFVYTGNIKALADGARNAGLNF